MGYIINNSLFSAHRKIFNLEEELEVKRKMSWQTYVDDHLMCEIEGNHLTSAAIIGHDGGVWAQSATFPAVLTCFHTPSSCFQFPILWSFSGISLRSVLDWHEIRPVRLDVAEQSADLRRPDSVKNGYWCKFW